MYFFDFLKNLHQKMEELPDIFTLGENQKDTTTKERIVHYSEDELNSVFRSEGDWYQLPIELNDDMDISSFFKQGELYLYHRSTFSRKSGFDRIYEKYEVYLTGILYVVCDDEHVYTKKQELDKIPKLDNYYDTLMFY